MYLSSLKVLGFLVVLLVAGSAYAVPALVATGKAHTIFVDGGVAFGMGSGTAGQLGKAQSKRKNPLPAELGIAEVRYVVAGENTSVFIKKDGSAVFLGYNYGMKKAVFVPTAIPLTAIEDVAVTDSGLLMVAAGNVYLWDMHPKHAPEQIKSITSIKQVAAGDGYAMALDVDGNVYTWGSNRFGQLGDSTYLDSPTPRLVVTGIKSISAGELHAVVVTAEGEALAWGNATHGKLGDGSGLEAPFAVKVRASGLKNVSAGVENSVAVTYDGRLLVWGEHNYKGSNTLLLSFVPMEISDVKNVREAVSSGGHIVVLTNEGELYAWGDNTHGQLGAIGNSKDVFAPVKIYHIQIEQAGM